MSNREQYFRKFPFITYRGIPCVNIMKRVDFNANVQKYLNNFYTYDMKDGQTIQSIAHDYYKDVDLDWLIYLTNDIVDPYHQVTFNNSTFNDFIKKKYGTIEFAQKKIYAYRNNYEADAGVILSISGYDALPGSMKKYWDPVYSPVGVAGYQRAKSEIFTSTNRIISIEYAEEQTANTNFIVDEIVRIPSDSLNTRGTVAAANTTSVILKHVEGDFERESNFNLKGDISGNTIEINYDTYTLIQRVIPELEESYFKQYSYYEFEFDYNEQKRSINVLDDSYSGKINDQLTKILK